MTNEGRSLRSQSPGNEPIVRITKQLIRKQEEKMRKISLCTLVALALLVSSAAIAQAGGSPQGTQGSSPGMSQPGSPGQQPGYPSSQQPGSTGTMGSQTDQNAPSQKPEKSEKKLKGCVQSEGGQYMLQTKKGNIALTGRDVSAHAGHEVAVKGTWESGGGSNSSAASSGSSGKTFNVASVDMISESCSGKKGSSGNMGTSSPSGTGQNTGGTSTQPPPQ